MGRAVGLFSLRPYFGAYFRGRVEGGGPCLWVQISHYAACLVSQLSDKGRILPERASSITFSAGFERSHSGSHLGRLLGALEVGANWHALVVHNDSANHTLV